MGALHFERALPYGVTLLDTIGSESGNPTGCATYGFMSDSEPPLYAIAELTPARPLSNEPSAVSRERTVTITGPLTKEEYIASIAAGNIEVDGPYKALSQDDTRIEVQATIPRGVTSELVIGGLLGFILNRPPRSQR